MEQSGCFLFLCFTQTLKVKANSYTPLSLQQETGFQTSPAARTPLAERSHAQEGCGQNLLPTPGPHGPESGVKVGDDRLLNKSEQGSWSKAPGKDGCLR